MAESIVNFVLGKLADVVVKEVLLQYGVHEQVETVSRELSRIQAFLKDADKKQITDERQKHWVKEVRDVAYSIEDVIDIFLLEVPQKPQKSSKVTQICCLLQAVKKVINRTKKIPAVHKLAGEIGQIETRMKEIEASRVRFGINNLGEGSGDIRLPVRPPVLPDIDPDIVGFEEDRKHLVKELLDETTKRRCVVSIWGPGGLGKTTLAQKVYNCNDVKGQFGHRIWVAISQKFELINILRKIARQMNLSDQPKEEEGFLTEIHMSLRGKKYLIVLDDVWTSDLWTQIGAAFPDENNGSRVLITTRFFDVSKGADPMCEPYKLGFLTEELSRELFLKIVFPNHDPNKSSFDDLSDILDQLVHKCGGLPLALVVLGGLLSKKPRTYTAWRNVFQTMRWHAEGKNCSEIIGTSYDDLSFALKSCFMYLAAYPEDYDIDAPSLLHMWIAEGFIPQEDNRTLEETAESFLEDLVQRSMIQVHDRNLDGSIKYIRIHDLLRDLALEKAKEENFLVVYSHTDDQTSLSRMRRVAIHNPGCDQLMSQNLRTLLCFHEKISMPNCSKQRLLKVVQAIVHGTFIDPRMFEGLTQLRYLHLAGKLSRECKKERLENVIGGMKFLQTLDVRELSGLYDLPDCVWHIKTLRHVYQNRIGMGPPPSAKLTNLQTIESMRGRASWETELLPHIPNLCTLKLNVQYPYPPIEIAITFLATLEHLISLCVDGYHYILDMRGFPFYQHLQSLKFFTEVPFTSNERINNLHEGMLPPHLTSLNITGKMFQQDPMPILEKLRCLKTLILDQACEIEKMSCSSEGFRQLEVLDISYFFLLKEWEIEKGAMPILKKLRIYGCEQLDVPQGLQYLTNLQKLDYWPLKNNADDDLIRNLCKHVPSLDFNW